MTGCTPLSSGCLQLLEGAARGAPRHLSGLLQQLVGDGCGNQAISDQPWRARPRLAKRLHSGAHHHRPNRAGRLRRVHRRHLPVYQDDDLADPDGATHSVPRDNVVFEAGYFQRPERQAQRPHRPRGRLEDASRSGRRHLCFAGRQRTSRRSKGRLPPFSVQCETLGTSTTTCSAIGGVDAAAGVSRPRVPKGSRLVTSPQTNFGRPPDHAPSEVISSENCPSGSTLDFSCSMTVAVHCGTHACPVTTPPPAARPPRSAIPSCVRSGCRRPGR